MEPIANPTLLKMLGTAAATAGGAAGNAYAWDKFTHPDKSLFKDIADGNIDSVRGMQAGFNALLGGLGGYKIRHGDALQGGSLIALSPVKDLAIGALPLVNQTKELVKDKLPEAMANSESSGKLNTMLLGGLGLGALGLGGIALSKYLKKKDIPEEKGKVKYKLHGKDGDPTTEAEVEIPIDSPEFSPKMLEGLGSGIRRQMGKTVRYNSFKRDPETGKMIPYDKWREKYVEHKEDGEKSAASVARPDASIEVNDDGSVDIRSEHALSLADNMDIAKAAAGRQWAEGAGAALTTGATGLGGALLGALAGNMTGSSPIVGGLAGGVLGAAVPTVLAKALAAMTPTRTQHQQDVHDNQVAASEYFIPGYAQFNAKKREEREEAEMEEKSKLRQSYDNLGGGGESFDGMSDAGDDDLDKYAAAPTPPPGPQGLPPVGPGMPPGQQAPAPVTMQSRVPVKPNPGPSQQSPGHARMDDVASKAGLVARQADERLSKPAFVVEHAVRPGVKSAASVDEVRDIMKRVYDENPSYWPYGLSPEGHDDLYVVRDAVTQKAAGFVGWQERTEKGRRIGSYSIGILPEFRGNGMAKESVAKVISKRASGVDEVRAYVMAHNTPSLHLADSLHIPVRRKF